MDPGGLLEHSGFKLWNGTVAFGVPRAAKGMEKEITMEQQALYLLKDLALVKECDSLSELKEKLILGDVSWRLLKEKLSFSEEFVQNNAARIGNFLFVGGAEIMETFLERQPSKSGDWLQQSFLENLTN